MASSRYSLPRHVYLCMSDGYIVVLDAKSNRYRALEATQTREVATLVPGWPVPEGAMATQVAVKTRRAEALAQDLVRKGILHAGPGGKEISATGLASITDQVNYCSGGDQIAVRTIALLKFFYAVLTAALVTGAFKLRCYSLDSLAASLARTKSRQLTNGQERLPQRVGELNLIFKRLSSTFFASRDACFFEALALVKFMSLHKVCVDWVFGVRAKPWHAHCWIQKNGVVLNDTLERVKLFTPIMAI